MKSILISFTLLLLTASGFAQKQFVMDPNAESRTVNSSFNSIKVSGGINLILSQSETEAIAVSASEKKFITDIQTVVEGNTLRIYVEGDRGWGTKNRQMKVYVSFKNLVKLEASGASDILVAGSIDVPSLDLHLSGASDFKGAVSVTSLSMDLSGASDVHINGTATTLKIESSGASDVKGFDLSTDICTAKASGASDINITVNKELNAHASGASEIYYQGSGIIKESHTSGASNIGKKGT